MFGIFIGIVYGLAVAIGLAMFITIRAMKKSNDIGDSQGTLADFNASVHITSSEDGLHRMM